MSSVVVGFCRSFALGLLLVAAASVVTADEPGGGTAQCGTANLQNFTCEGNTCWGSTPRCVIHSMGGGVFECHCVR
jgi:hypothetical protein